MKTLAIIPMPKVSSNHSYFAKLGIAEGEIVCPECNNEFNCDGRDILVLSHDDSEIALEKKGKAPCR